MSIIFSGHLFWNVIFVAPQVTDNLLILKSASEYFFELDFKKREIYTLS